MNQVHSWSVVEAAAWGLMAAALVLTNAMFSFWWPVPLPSVSYSQWGDSFWILVIAYAQLPFWLALSLLVVLGLLPAPQLV